MKHIAFAMLSVLALGGSATAQPDGRTLHVANNGVDSPGCGNAKKPCRSLTQAMDNASDGDKVVVGIGRYGDVNRDGDLLDPGDERGDSPLGCLVCVTKSLRIVSVSGAVGTVIDSRIDPNQTFDRMTGVSIRSSHVSFGAKDAGFTIIGASNNGLEVIHPAHHVRIEGNIALENAQHGFNFVSLGGPIRSLTVSDNVAAENHIVGFFGWSRNAIVDGNTAVGNDTGILFEGNNNIVQNNRVDGNSSGVKLDGTEAVFRDNTVTNNNSSGFEFGNQDELIPGVVNLRAFTRNTVVGNRGTGIALARFATVAGIHLNNIFGNATDAVFLNCGLLNLSGTNVIATRNFWGLPRGPGVDPADDACSDEFSTVMVDPVATSFIR